jgi:uracil-DNA glycosylase
MKPAALLTIVERIRASRADPRSVPGLDPRNGNEAARVLLVLEAPGPGAVESQVVSIENIDPTARNLKSLLKYANLTPADIAVWNVVPWYCGSEDFKKIAAPSARDIEEGTALLCDLISCMPKLQAVVLIGSTARKAHIRLSAEVTVRILACHHPSQRVLNLNSAAETENQRVFARLGELLA